MGQRSNRIRVGVAVTLTLLCTLLACRGEQPTVKAVWQLEGSTMGTTYHVTIVEQPADSNFQARIDSLLRVINQEVSTYEPQSLISRFNNGDTILLPIITDLAAAQALQTEPGAHFSANLLLAQNPIAHSNGYFDPTVGPLVEYYGFGASKPGDAPLDAAEVRRLHALTGMDKVSLDTLIDAPSDTLTDAPPARSALRLSIREPGVRLDLSAIAKGYGVDQVFAFIQQQYAPADLFVEIGGEARAQGLSPRGDAWSVGINTPDPEAKLTDMVLLINLENMSIATSGNYRNMRVRGGQQIVHTVDPHTGLPRQSTLLSASVLAPDCATADAYATACMASGEDALEVLAKAGLPACLIFATPDDNYEIKYVGEFTRYVQHMPDR